MPLMHSISRNLTPPHLGDPCQPSDIPTLLSIIIAVNLVHLNAEIC